MAADTSSLTPLERARAFLDSLRSNQHYDHTALDGLEVVSAERGRVVCRLTPTQQHANRYGTVHGGCIATLVDVIGSAAIVTQADRGGVSLSISTHYLAPCPLGAPVEIEAVVARIGKQIATAAVSLRVDGKAVAQGTHVKALVPHSDVTALWELAVQDREAAKLGRPVSRL